MKCEIVRANTESRNSERESAVRFLAAIGESGDRLRESFPDLPDEPDAKTVFTKLRELRNQW